MRKHKSFWDRNAGRYDRFMRKERAAYDEMYELIRPVVRHKTVLELATGTGLIAKHIVNAALGRVSDLAGGDAEEVERESHGLAVEVAAGDNGLVVEEHQRVIGDGVELDLDLLTDVLERVAAGAAPACVGGVPDV